MTLHRTTSAPGAADGARSAVAAAPRTIVMGRTLFAFLGFSALVTEIATLVAQHRFAAGDFFSYFTVEANGLAVVSLVLSSYATVAGRHSAGLRIFRGAVALYMTTVILIFLVLLSGYPSSDLTAVPWDNTVLHYILPIVILIDWLIDRRPPPIPLTTALSWLVVPLVYFVYSLVRGHFTSWYPYPFMNPSRHGYVAVFVTALVIAVVLAVLTCAVAAAGSARVRPSDPGPVDPATDRPV